jgi:hypothetical protein
MGAACALIFSDSLDVTAESRATLIPCALSFGFNLEQYLVGQNSVLARLLALTRLFDLMSCQDFSTLISQLIAAERTIVEFTARVAVPEVVIDAILTNADPGESFPSAADVSRLAEACRTFRGLHGDVLRLVAHHIMAVWPEYGKIAEPVMYVVGRGGTG